MKPLLWLNDGLTAESQSESPKLIVIITIVHSTIFGQQQRAKKGRKNKESGQAEVKGF